MAKPKRRKFTASSTADSGGGRELHAARRGGPAASPRGAVQLPSDGMAGRGDRDWLVPSRPDPEQTRSGSTAERNPLSAKVHELEASGYQVAQGKCRNTSCSHRRSAWRRRPARRASFYGSRDDARPGPVCVRTRARPRRARQPAFLRRPVTGRGSRRCSMKASICAERTMYRILAANQPVRERRNQRRLHQAELVATGPNQTWSWDSPGPGAQTLDVLLPLCLARHLQPLRRGLDGCRSGERRARRDADMSKQGIEPLLAFHDDQQVHRPSPRRPRGHPLSEPPPGQRDNPFSEAQFKTLKYHPGFPGRFEDITAAIAFCRSFFPWYNTEHRHAGIAMLTPDDVHHHRVPDVLAQRGRTLQAAWAHSPRTLRPRHPETRPASRSRLDQPTRHFHNRRNESVNRNRRCLKVVDRRFERDSGVRAGVPSEVAERLKALERENRDLRQVNEILRKASAYFAQAELDRRFKP